MVEDCLLDLRCCDYQLKYSHLLTFSSMIIDNVHLIIMQCIIPKSKVVIITSIISLTCGLSHTSINLFLFIPHHFPISLSPPTAAHRLNILIKKFCPGGKPATLNKQCTDLQNIQVSAVQDGCLLQRPEINPTRCLQFYGTEPDTQLIGARCLT